jgi:eukaryotic-like serine/threonine-protein kinase
VATTHRPSLLAALRQVSSSTGDSEEARALFQQRLSLFFKVGCLISALFLVVANLIGLGFDPKFSGLDSEGNRWHLAVCLVTAAFWALTSRGRIALGKLEWLDAVFTPVVMIAYAMVMRSFIHVIPQRGDLIMMLIGMVIFTSRAVVVPSTPRHTAIVSTIGSIPIVWIAYLAGTTSAARPSASFLLPVYDSLWCFTAIVIATLASRVIYGLRVQAAEALRLGQYVLDQKIGEGGMGSVYKARHALLRRPTAIKLLPLEKAGAHTVSRFEREVQHTSRLTHPNTVAIYDYGRTPSGVFYYAMEYLEGIDLQKLVDEFGAQSPSRVVHILTQVCGSLAEAHASGLVHRDVKPANIILCERGGVLDTAKVVDFGLVKDVASGTNVSLSNVSTLLGTPLYMSPEAIVSPDDVDGRSDVYSLGAVAYLLLTGEPVFDGGSVMDVCSQHLHQTVTPPSVRASRQLPIELDRAILQCLEKKPDQRYQSVAEFRDALFTCKIDPWTAANARQWWQEHPVIGPARVETHITHQTQDGVSPTAVTVDVKERMIAELRSGARTA